MKPTRNLFTVPLIILAVMLVPSMVHGQTSDGPALALDAGQIEPGSSGAAARVMLPVPKNGSVIITNLSDQTVEYDGKINFLSSEKRGSTASVKLKTSLVSGQEYVLTEVPLFTTALVADIQNGIGLSVDVDGVRFPASPFSRSAFVRLGSAGSADVLLYNDGDEAVSVDLGADGQEHRLVTLQTGEYRVIPLEALGLDKSHILLLKASSPVAVSVQSNGSVVTLEGFEADLPFERLALIGNHNVPYLRQRDYTGIGESSCGATSTAMALRFYFPNSRIDVREIYHAGLQAYGYHGPAKGYRNLSWGSGYTTDPGDGAIPPGYSGYYTGRGSSYLRGNWVLQNYLARTWQVNTNVLTTIDQVYAAVSAGPLIGHVWGHGNVNWGHYLVVISIDDRGTVNRNDDIVYVHDPYDKWGSWDTGGQNKPISYQQFFVSGARYGNKWFRDAIQLIPQDSATARLYTTVVDTGHNATSGNATIHRFEVDNINDYVGTSSTLTWWHWYGDGDWVYPKEDGHAARWTPSLPMAGCYDVITNLRGDNTSGNVTYVLYNSSGLELARTTVNQNRNPAAWVQATIASGIPLANGAYLRAFPIAVNTNVDSVKFRYRAGTCGSIPAPPAGVSATDGAFTDRIRVTWLASPNATSYEIWRGTSNSPSSAIGLGSVATLAFDDTGTAPGQTFWYWLKAKNSSGTSGFSAGDSGWRKAASTVPAPPNGVAATDGTYTNRVRVTWLASANATAYEIWRATSSSPSYAIQLGSTTGLLFDDPAAVPGQIYWYWVKAKNAAGTSGFSSGDSGWRARSYYSSPVSTTNGGGNLGASNLFTFSVTIVDGRIGSFSLRKTDGSLFSSSGTLFLKVGGYLPTSFTRSTKAVPAGTRTITFDPDVFDNYPPNTYPKAYYVRYEIPGTNKYQWAGPLTISINN